MKKCILILGMHRSGTSLLSGLLTGNGIFSGNNLLPPLIENEKGFFEIQEIYEFNEGLLNQIGTRWNMIKNIKKELLCIENNKIRLKNIINNHFKEYNTFLIKDPRICILFPLYHSVLSELKIEIYPVIIKRDIYEVILSLNKRDQYSYGNGYALYKFYYKNLYKYLNDDFMTVKYQDLIFNPKVYIEKIFNFIEISKVEADVNFLDITLRHNHPPGFLKKIHIKFVGEIKYIYFRIKNKVNESMHSNSYL